MGGKRKTRKPQEDEDDETQKQRQDTSGARAKKKAMWGSGSSGSLSKRGGSKSSRTNSSRSVNDAGAAKMFADIADLNDPNVASMEGICKFCEKLGIDAMEDVRILVLLWRMGAVNKPAQINKEEWIQGCTKLQLDSIDKFKSALPSMDTGFLERSDFKEFYKFCFQFNREGTYKTLDKELVIALMQLVLKGTISEDRLSTFTDFLGQTKGDTYTRITLDQWTSFLDFCYECESLEEYDEATSAWPVLIDEYVEFMEALKK